MSETEATAAGEAKVVPGGLELPPGAEPDALSDIPPEQVPLLPGELRPHPTPFQYVMIGVVLVVLTALEVTVSYLEGDIPNGLIILLLLVMMVAKFVLVAAWYMHLRTDRPIYRRFFAVGAAAAIMLFLVVLSTLHFWASHA
ncbi:MAG: cytochrome C oxidase subunit IV family protein [Actinobacteria bacterium]|nr:cytochrome C oxidase subunit IV family protein [Actinomycetota bacterium]